MQTNCKNTPKVQKSIRNEPLDGLFQVQSGKTRGLTTKGRPRHLKREKERNGALGVPFGVQNGSFGSPWGDPGALKWGPWGLLGALGDPLGANRATLGTRWQQATNKLDFVDLLLAQLLINILLFVCYFRGYVLGLFLVQFGGAF